MEQRNAGEQGGNVGNLCFLIQRLLLLQATQVKQLTQSVRTDLELLLEGL